MLLIRERCWERKGEQGVRERRRKRSGMCKGRRRGGERRTGGRGRRDEGNEEIEERVGNEKLRGIEGDEG